MGSVNNWGLKERPLLLENFTSCLLIVILSSAKTIFKKQTLKLLLSLHMKMCYKYNLSLEEGLIRFIRAWVLNKSNGVDSTCFVVNLPSNLYLDTLFALEWQWLGYLPHQTVDCTWPFRCRTKLYLKTNQRQIFECLSLFEVYL